MFITCKLDIKLHTMTFLGNNDGLCDLIVKLSLTFFSCMQPPSNAVCGQFSRPAAKSEF